MVIGNQIFVIHKNLFFECYQRTGCENIQMNFLLPIKTILLQIPCTLSQMRTFTWCQGYFYIHVAILSCIVSRDIIFYLVLSAFTYRITSNRLYVFVLMCFSLCSPSKLTSAQTRSWFYYWQRLRMAERLRGKWSFFFSLARIQSQQHGDGASSGCRWSRRPPAMEDSLQYIEKQSRTAEKVWFFSLAVGREDNSSSP